MFSAAVRRVSTPLLPCLALESGRISARAAHATLWFRREPFEADVVLREIATAEDPIARRVAIEHSTRGFDP